MVIVEKDKFGSIVIDGTGRIDEGDKIEFVVESTGEVKQGNIIKICGSVKERKFQILPENSECEELWSIFSIKEGTLKVIK